MTVAFVSASAWFDGATGLTADKVLTLPSHSTGNIILVLAAWKDYAITAQISGYTEITEFAEGSVATGNGTGSMKVGAWYKVATSGAESNPTLDFSTTTGLVGEAVVHVYSTSLGNWATPTFVTAAHASSAGPVTRTSSGTTNIPANSAVACVLGISDDSATITRGNLGIDYSGGSGSGAAFSANYVEMPATHASTTTGNDMAADAGYRIFGAITRTGANLTATITALTAAETGALLWVVLSDIAEPAGTTIYPTDTASAVSVPSATLVSSFTGSDEDPLSEGGIWSRLSTSDSGAFTRTSNQAGVAGTGTRGSYYNAADYGNVGVYATVAVAGIFGVAARIQGAGGADTWDGYVAVRSDSANLVLYRVDNAVRTSIGSFFDGASPFIAGGKLGISCEGTLIRAWWQTSGGDWKPLVSSTDSTYQSAGKVGLYTLGAASTIRVDDFSVGDPMLGTKREAWTSRGAGVQTDVTNTVAGPTAPIQLTDTAGGTVVDWFTRPLAAFTLSTAVRVNVRALESNAAANAIVGVQIAQVAADGTSPTVWGTTDGPTELGTSEAAASLLVVGSDLAITNGQYLRVRFYIDDASGVSMAAAHTVTLYYAGTSGGASGDTYLTFTQTLTEFSAGQLVTPTTAALVITRNIPTVPVSNNQRVEPTTKALTSATFAPSVRLGQIVTVPTAGGAGYAAAVVASSPLAYYRMGEPSGSVLDSIGSAHGTITGTVTRDATGLITSGDDGAISFAGSGYFEAAWPAAIAQVWTIEFWFKMPSIGASTTILSSSNFWVFVNSAGGMACAVNGSNVITAANGSVTAGTTYHLVWSRPSITNTANKLYLNSVDVSVAASSPTSPDTATTFRFGEYIDGSESFLGVADELAIYSSALSAADVLAHYNAASAAGGLVLTKYAPTIRQGTGVIPTTKALTLATFAPTARTPILATPTTVSLTITELVPLIRTPILATPAAVSLVLTKYAPTVTAAANVTVAPNAVSLITSPQVPTVTASDHQRVTPTTKALTLTAYAPTVSAFQGQTVTPTTTSLTLAAFAPAARTPILATPTTKALVATKYAPTVTTPQTITPTTKALVTTRYEPAVRLHQLVTPAKATLTATKYAPTVTTPIRAVPSTKSLALTPFAPVVTAGNVQSVTPTTAAILLTKYVPVVSVTAHLAVVPPAATLTVTKFAPTVSATAHVVVTPAVKTLTLSVQVPTVALTAHVAVIVPKATLTITHYAPSLEQTNDVVAIPTTKSLTLSALTPTVTATANVAFAPTTKAVTITKFAPTVRTPILATPATRALTTTRFAPQARTPLLTTPGKKTLVLTAYTPTVSSPVRVTPAKATLTTTRYAPTLVAPQTITVPPKSLGITTYAPIARVAYRFTPITATLTTASFAPVISTTFNAVVRPEYGELTITEYPPTLDISGHQGIVPGTAVLVITPYPPTAEQHSITPLPRPIYGFAIVAVGPGAGVGSTNGSATVTTVEGGSTTVSTSGPSARVTIR